MDLLENYKEIDDIDFDPIKNMDCMELHEKIEKRKMFCRMTKAAIILQRAWRDFKFFKFCFQNKI